MKLAIASILLFSAASAHAESFFCAEAASDAVQQRRAQYAVSIVEKSDITDPRVVGDFDYAKNVEVTVLSRSPNLPAKFAPARPKFAAVAKIGDVSYFVDAKRKEGVYISMYLDELDQTTVTLKGIKKSLQMKCSRSN